VLGDVGVLEEHDVVVGRRGRDGVPDAVQRVLEVVGLELDLETPISSASPTVASGASAAASSSRALRSRGVPRCSMSIATRCRGIVREGSLRRCQRNTPVCPSE
jgi:hypothetical protein